MKCHKIVAYLSDYLDREIETLRNEEIERHLKACVDCFSFYQTFKKTVLLYRTWGKTSLPKKVRHQVYYSLKIESYYWKKDGET